MSWYLSRLAGFDLETTGVSPERDRIVTACVVQCGGSQPVASATWMADPGVEIPEQAAAVHSKLANATLDDLHAQQIVWAREQAESLAEYFRNTPGKEDRAKTVRGDWPLIPHQRTGGAA